MMQFQRHREGAFRDSRNGIQPFDDRDLPRRSPQVDLAAVQPRDLDAQLPPVTRLRQADVADVVLEVEVRIVHPIRSIETGRKSGQPPAEDIREMQPRVEFLENPLERDLSARRGRRVIDQQQLNLQWRRRRLRAQQHVIRPTQLPHFPTLGSAKAIALLVCS